MVSSRVTGRKEDIMDRQQRIEASYRKAAGHYDHMLGVRGWWSRLFCRLVWGFADTAYTERLLAWVPDDFAGQLLDVPVGTALFTGEKYACMHSAQITCLDYSEEMLQQARRRFAAAGLTNIVCLQGDVGRLPFAAQSFDLVLSMNGFHAFPDKEAAFSQTAHVLKPGGGLIGCFYIQGQNRRTDWFIRRFYVPRGFFTPPFMTRPELAEKLRSLYREAELFHVGAIACFRCRK